ncbi:hypothetical protein Pyn_34545 [Prunus yedoensis var. nudiflora]|uniref:Uncharacterized protein n=1 Tax=Prunus yedoensis var. nudiflora TaxID=2094558 RepID=A0A314Y9I4_PRUYE|nr:hypothetical protein Pyn_34545 [Prunus yedoensis var. nudiflora]
MKIKSYTYQTIARAQYVDNTIRLLEWKAEISDQRIVSNYRRRQFQVYELEFRGSGDKESGTQCLFLRSLFEVGFSKLWVVQQRMPEF